VRRRAIAERHTRHPTRARRRAATSDASMTRTSSG
jgi:hypothetical protein